MCEWLFDATGNEVVAGSVDWVIGRPLTALIILIVAFVLRRMAHRAIDRFVARAVAESAEEDVRDPAKGGAAVIAHQAKRMLREPVRNERAAQRAMTLGAVLRSFATVVILTIAGLLVLAEFSIDLAPLIAGAGIAGVALGFGAQSVVRDVLSGMFMLLEDQFGVGDVIDVDIANGVVEGVGFRTTRLRDVEGTLWHVPNGEIRRVGNMSQLWARTILDVEVAYDTDLDLAAGVIKTVADELYDEQPESARVLEPPEVWGVENLGPDSVAIRLALKTEPSAQWTAARLLRRRLKAAFDEHGIEIPFPQRTVWLHPSPAADAAPLPATTAPDARTDADAGLPDVLESDQTTDDAE